MDGGIIHGGVGMGVAVVARSATIDTRHKDGAVEESRVIKSVLLIHEGLLNLGSELADILSRETAAVAVGDIVAGSPADIVEVGDMVGGCGTIECRHLLMVAHDEEEGGCGVGGCGVGVLALDIGGDGSGGGTHTRSVGVNDVGKEALAAFPLHEVVQLPMEGAVGHDEVADGGCGAHRLGIKTVHGTVAGSESRGMVSVEEG